MTKTVRLGGASGYWGESDMAWGQLLNATPSPDYLVFDYLAEITMSLLARMRAKDPSAGYVPDFVTQLRRHLPQIAGQKVKLIANAGGVNAEQCGEAVRKAIAEAGLNLKVSVITGDDLMDRLDQLEGQTDMFSGEPWPETEHILSANAYLGAFPIAAALDAGADIVITGRCVDSAVTLGALIHEFGWGANDFDVLAQGSLIGHLIECGPQVTGGNFTDWQAVMDQGAVGLVDIGYPIAEVADDGSAMITKPNGTGGLVNRGTVVEQMLYEIGDPAAYNLPDVICDFTDVIIEQDGPDRVKVTGAKGRGRPERYKASITVSDGYRLSVLFFMVGADATKKARYFHDAALARTRRALRQRNLGDFDQVALELIGDDSHFGGGRSTREIAFRMSVRHSEAKACALLLKEASGLGLATPAGLVMYSGARPKPQSVTRLFSTLVDRDGLDLKVDGRAFTAPSLDVFSPPASTSHIPPSPSNRGDITVPLSDLAWLRSGDKGDKANIGVAARNPDFMPYIWDAVTDAVIAEQFAHLVSGSIERWYLPGSQSLNILMDKALGGGGMASLRNDPQGKSFGQVLADLPVCVPQSLL